MATINYDVPYFKGTPQLDRYGDFDGNALLTAVIKGDGPAVAGFLEGLAAQHNEAYDQAERRATALDAVLAAIDPIVAGTTLTGFKARANPDPKTKYRTPKVTNEGEGCQAPYCALAGKFRLPEWPDPENRPWRDWDLACQKHTIEAIDSRAQTAANPGGRHVYLTSDQHRVITDRVRTALANKVD